MDGEHVQRTAWIIAFVISSVACIGGWTLATLSDRRVVLAAATENLEATARLLEQHADRALEAGDRVVRAAVLAAGDVRLVREENRAAALTTNLNGLVAGNQQIASVWVLDADGYEVADSWTRQPDGISYRNRGYFQAHVNGERALHVGMVAIGSSVQQARFTLSRPLLGADGTLAGVVAASVLSNYFADVYAEAGLGDGARFALFRNDGAPLAIWPSTEGVIAALAITRAALVGGGGAGGDRLVAERRLSRFPVHLVVSQPIGVVLAEWRTRTWAAGSLLAGLVVLLGGLTVLGLRGARQQQALLSALRNERATLERRVEDRTSELAVREAALRDTLESMTDAYVALDHEFRVVDVNSRALTLDGRPAALILGRSHWEVWPEAVGTPVESAYRRAMAARVPVQLEHRYISATHDLWLDIRAFPTANGLAVFYCDITARKRSDAVLRESELQRRIATEGAGVGIWQVDLVTGLGRWSAEAKALFGTTRDTFTPDDWTDAIHPADRARAAEAWRQAVEEGARYEVEFRAAAPGPGGGERWLLSRGGVEQDPLGRPLRGAGVMLDVTDRVRAEAETRRTLAELRMLYDSAPVGLCVFDLEGRFVRINERLAAMNGLPIAAHIGRTPRELLPALADAAEDLLRRVTDSGAPVLNVEIIGETPARPGVQRVWEEHWYPLRDGDGHLIGVAVVAEEVTERKAAEQRQLLLAREVDHRAKNALTMVQSILRLTRAPDPESFARTVEGRVAALARAQGLLADVHWSGVDLYALFDAELSAFLPHDRGVTARPACAWRVRPSSSHPWQPSRCR